MELPNETREKVVQRAIFGRLLVVAWPLLREEDLPVKKRKKPQLEALRKMGWIDVDGHVQVDRVLGEAGGDPVPLEDLWRTEWEKDRHNVRNRAPFVTVVASSYRLLLDHASAIHLLGLPDAEWYLLDDFRSYSKLDPVGPMSLTDCGLKFKDSHVHAIAVSTPSLRAYVARQVREHEVDGAVRENLRFGLCKILGLDEKGLEKLSRDFRYRSGLLCHESKLDGPEAWKSNLDSYIVKVGDAIAERFELLRQLNQVRHLLDQYGWDRFMADYRKAIENEYDAGSGAP